MATDEGRRRSVRVLTEGLASAGTIVSGNHRIPVLVCDESVHGVGLVAVNAVDLQLGGNVVFESSVRHVEGRVGSIRYVQMPDVRIYRIGLEWVD